MLTHEPDYQVPPSGQDIPVSGTGLTDGESPEDPDVRRVTRQ